MEEDFDLQEYLDLHLKKFKLRNTKGERTIIDFVCEETNPFFKSIINQTKIFRFRDEQEMLTDPESPTSKQMSLKAFYDLSYKKINSQNWDSPS